MKKSIAKGLICLLVKHDQHRRLPIECCHHQKPVGAKDSGLQITNCFKGIYRLNNSSSLCIQVKLTFLLLSLLHWYVKNMACVPPVPHNGSILLWTCNLPTVQFLTSPTQLPFFPKYILSCGLTPFFQYLPNIPTKSTKYSACSVWLSIFNNINRWTEALLIFSV